MKVCPTQPNIIKQLHPIRRNLPLQNWSFVRWSSSLAPPLLPPHIAGSKPGSRHR